MKTTLHVILTIYFSALLVIGYGQSASSWKDFPASSSVEKLQEFIKIEKEDAAKDWDDSERIAFAKKGYQAAETLNSVPDMIYFSQRLGSHYHYADSFSQAIHYLNIAIDLDYDTLTVARAYNRLGYFYFDVGDYTNALKYFFNSVKYGKMLNRGWETYPFGNITNVYKHLEDYDNAIKYAKASVVLDQQADFPEREYGLIYNYTNLLIFNEKKGTTDSCSYYIDLINQNIAVIDTIDNSNYSSAIRYAHTIIADFYIKTDDLNQARTHLDLAKEKQRDEFDEDILLIEGRYWLKRKDYNEVKKIIQKYETISVYSFGSIENLQQLKIDYYTGINDFKRVADIRAELLQTQKEKFGDNRLRYGAFANAEFQNLEQQQKIANLQNQQKLNKLRSRNRNYIFLIAFIVIAGFTAFFWYRSRRNKQLSLYLDEQVRIKTKDLEQANYELRTFNYIASHDIKEPIRNIGNYASLVFRRLPDDLKAKFDDYFKIIRQSTQQLYTLIEDFAHYTALSKDKNVDVAATDLNSLIENLEHGLEETVQKYNGKIINHGLPTLETNSSLLYIILKNLIENGLKYNQSETPTVELSHQKTGNTHEILIKDNGIGIEAAYFDKIFEMFSRLHNRGEYEGSGIGLAIVKLLTQKLNATINLESEVGGGSTFTIVLPQ